MRVYLDYNATAPLTNRARQAIADSLDNPHDRGNPSSLHWAGRAARALLEEARETVAGVIGASPGELIFTGSGTESNNLAIRGVREVPIVTTAIEHSSILRAAQWERERLDRQIFVLPVDSEGRLDCQRLAALLAGRPCLVSLALANNEVGVIQDIQCLSQTVHGAGGVLHVDAVQAAGKIAIDVTALGADLLSLSAHKVGGPAGVGALYARDGIPLEGIVFGGAQEGGRRAGTENVAGAVGFAAALTEAEERRVTENQRLRVLREKLWQGISALVPAAVRNSPRDGALANTLNVSFPGLAGDLLAAALDLQGVAVSTGSACAAGGAEPSHVLQALGKSREEVRGAIRFSLGPATTDEEIEYTLSALARVLATAASGMMASVEEEVG